MRSQRTTNPASAAKVAKPSTIIARSSKSHLLPGSLFVAEPPGASHEGGRLVFPKLPAPSGLGKKGFGNPSRRISARSDMCLKMGRVVRQSSSRKLSSPYADGIGMQFRSNLCKNDRKAFACQASHQPLLAARPTCPSPASDDDE